MTGVLVNLCCIQFVCQHCNLTLYDTSIYSLHPLRLLFESTPTYLRCNRKIRYNTEKVDI